MYKVNDEKEDDPELYFEEEFKYPAWEDIANPETWVHIHQILLKVKMKPLLSPNSLVRLEELPT